MEEFDMIPDEMVCNTLLHKYDQMAGLTNSGLKMAAGATVIRECYFREASWR